MRTCWGWVAAVLLAALVFSGGPDAIDITPTQAQTLSAVGASHETRDYADQRLADRDTHAHLRLLALPPAPQTIAPAPVKGAAVMAAEPQPITAGSVEPRLGACSLEALQIFRC